MENLSDIYIVTYVAQLDPQGNPVIEGDEGRVVKEVNIWDERDQVELAVEYAKNGVLPLRRPGYQHTTGRRLEWRGELSIFTAYLIAIGDDLKSGLKQRAGPADYVPHIPEGQVR